jgi:hypothetical protein
VTCSGDEDEDVAANVLIFWVRKQLEVIITYFFLWTQLRSISLIKMTAFDCASWCDDDDLCCKTSHEEYSHFDAFT